MGKKGKKSENFDNIEWEEMFISLSLSISLLSYFLSFFLSVFLFFFPTFFLSFFLSFFLFFFFSFFQSFVLSINVLYYRFSHHPNILDKNQKHQHKDDSWEKPYQGLNLFVFVYFSISNQPISPDKLAACSHHWKYPFAI